MHISYRMALYLLLLAGSSTSDAIHASLGVSPDAYLIGWEACGDGYYMPHKNMQTITTIYNTS